MLSARIDLGPVLRTLRRQPAVLAMVILEIAAGVATLTALLLSGSWYGAIGGMHSGLDERALILVSTYTPGTDEDALAAAVAADRARARAVPGVEAVASVSVSILDERWTYPAMFHAGRRDGIGWPVFAEGDVQRALGLKLLTGALPDDTRAAAAGGERDAVVTRCLAEEMFGGVAAAVGGALTAAETPPLRVRAVVEDVRMRVPFMPSSVCTVFVWGGGAVGHEARLLVRVAPAARAGVLARLPAALENVGAGRWVEAVALDTADTNHHRIGHGLVQLLTFFGGLVALIALLGALAATSFLVAERTRQIGVRRALGATKADIVGYFLVENAVTMFVGSLIGLGGTALLFLMMRRFFQGMSIDAGVIALGVGLFWLATLAATLIPAHRAARVPPSVASRSL